MKKNGLVLVGSVIIMFVALAVLGAATTHGKTLFIGGTM